MKYMKIGKSGIEASVISLGTCSMANASFWGYTDDNESVRTILHAGEVGINLLDTAPLYGFGHSEEVVGKAIKGKRSEFIVATKFGMCWESEEGAFVSERDGKKVFRNLSPKSIKREVEISLKRMGTDYIDIYMPHFQSMEPFLTPIPETMGCLCQLKKEGKIRAIGLSNITCEQVEEYLKWGQVDLVQEKYSMLDRSAEKTLFPLCEKNVMTFQTFSPLERGILSGRIDVDTKVEGTIRNMDKLYLPENRKKLGIIFEKWQPLCEKYGCSIANLVISWTASRSENINLLCGSRKISHVDDNVKSVGIILEEADKMTMQNDMEKFII